MAQEAAFKRGEQRTPAVVGGIARPQVSELHHERESSGREPRDRERDHRWRSRQDRGVVVISQAPTCLERPASEPQSRERQRFDPEDRERW